MAENAKMGIEAFLTKLGEHYRKLGEPNIEDRIESLSLTILRQNKERNPYIFSAVSDYIIGQNIRFRYISFFKWEC